MYKLRNLMVLFSIVVMVAILAMVQGCSESESPVESVVNEVVNPDQSMEIYFDTTFIDEATFFASQPAAAKIGAKMVVAWPFSSLQRMSDWTGWTGDRTEGSNKGGPFCSRTRPTTHSGAEFYARDLNQKRGLDYGVMIFAGFAGKVIKAGDYNDGYGNQVVIYDPSRGVAIRYAHLSYIYHSGVKVGRYIPRHRFIGRVGSSGNSSGSHLHIVGYENLNRTPTIPNLCDSDHYACKIDFYWWNY